jgi:cell division protein FtsW (lipid II flippase)
MAITLQALINIGVVTVVLPTKGIPLPFISAGGTSMLLTSAAVGILLNIVRQSQNTVGVFVPEISYGKNAFSEDADA